MKPASVQAVCWFVVGFVVSLSGCGAGPQAEFQLRDATLDLIPDAQKTVKKTLKEGFGTPHDLVAWERFPVAYGGVKGTVAAAAEGTKLAPKTIAITFDGTAPTIAKDAPLLWLSGARAGEKHATDKVEQFDPATNQLKWSGSTEPAPAPGDKIAIGFGDELRHGRLVYMKNCMHCHGVSGDGNGPTAKYLYPLPRDYRLGTFKFKSTKGDEKISRDDLTRVVKYGIPGTYMPSFLLLGDDETKVVVEYVRWLSMRGEFEKRIDDNLADYTETAVKDTVTKAKAAADAAKKSGEKVEKPISSSQARKDASEAFAKYQKEDMDGEVDDTATFISGAWARAEEEASRIVPSVPRVADDAASRERGRLMYMSDKAKCYTCHGMLGRGDGAANEDFWKKPGSNDTWPRRGLHDDWGHQLQPRNLTLGQYRGGRRPIDIFRRVYAGIKGTPMPGFGGTALKDEEIWDVVNYVMSLPYQSSPPPKTNSGGHVAVTEAAAAK